ncbi:DUF3168 domain-containing protein [Halopseudomonas sp.]|uniref:DUF3168 domain-containing protein n=1 Tax=Halopseudomonas sp. TaxID=2901191 RepID=UPI00311F5E61
MFAPIFAVCAASAGVTAALGTAPVRLFPFGESPEGVGLPYAVWQTVSGSPENFINEVPDMDGFTLQVDVYGSTADSVRAAAEALRDAIEPHAHIVSWGGESREPTTRRYRFTFSVDWFVSR